MKPDIDILLAKYFGGEASVEDLNRLDDWLVQSEANQIYFDQMTVLYEKSARFTPARKPGIEDALGKFEQYMQQSENEDRQKNKLQTKKYSLKFYLQIAAVFIAFIGVSLFFYLQKGNDRGSIHTIAALNLPVEHVMPDGSKLQLSPDSKIVYEQDYGVDNRSIDVSGKVNIEVGAKSDVKLIVTAGETFIEDIGTVFTVTAYPDDVLITVFVESGKVHFYTSDNSGVELIAGETGIFHKQNKTFEKQLPSKKNEVTDLIIFDATPLSEVVKVLSLQYGTSIEIDGAGLANTQITVSFKSDETLDYILQIIAETLQLNIILEGHTYKLSFR